MMTVDEILALPELKAAYVWVLQNTIRLERVMCTNIPTMIPDIDLISDYERSLTYLLKTMRPWMNDELIIRRIDVVYERLKSTTGKEGILSENSRLLIIEEAMNN